MEGGENRPEQSRNLKTSTVKEGNLEKQSKGMLLHPSRTHNRVNNCARVLQLVIQRQWMLALDAGGWRKSIHELEDFAGLNGTWILGLAMGRHVGENLELLYNSAKTRKNVPRQKMLKDTCQKI